MSVEDRNAAWKGKLREFHQVNSRAGTRFWSVKVSGPIITTMWGKLGGASQTVSETVQGVNIGKKNEKSPSQYALERASEIVRKKSLEGYREVLWESGRAIFLDPVQETKIDFDNLPASLSFYKPDNTMGAKITKLAEAGKVWYTRKRNGMMTVLCKGSKELNIYSRRMLRQHDDEQGGPYTWDDRFEHIIKLVEPHLPPNTILLGELVVEESGAERFDLAQSYIKSLTPKALEEIGTRGPYPFFYCWDVAFWNGNDLVSTAPMEKRIETIRWLDSRIATDSVFRALEVYRCADPAEAIEIAKTSGWEGFVVIDPTAIYGDKAYNFKGKPDRPGTACAKLKPEFEDDFIAMWDPEKGFGERSTKGSRAGGIKSVGLYQYNPKGELVFVANVSSGLTKEFLLEQASPALYPQVWEVAYSGRRFISQGDDTNALDFPRFVRTRQDKTPNECVNPDLQMEGQ